MQDMIITPPAETGTCRVGTNNLGLTSSSAVETFGQFEQIMNRFFNYGRHGTGRITLRSIAGAARRGVSEAIGPGGTRRGRLERAPHPRRVTAGRLGCRPGMCSLTFSSPS